MASLKSKYTEELTKNAAYLGVSEKGILVADRVTGARSKGYIGSLFRDHHTLKFLCGIIVSKRTFCQETKNEKSIGDWMKDHGVLLGINVDKGTIVLPGTDGETTTQGLDDLGKRCAKYYEAGARFAKWRAVLKIGPNEPSQLSVHENAYGLARYAAICQENGLVPIVEPEILVDGSHDIDRCAEVTENVLAACYKALSDHHVMLEGTLLKPNMVTPGSDAKKVPNDVIAKYTVRSLQRTVPPAVPAVVFLSGGQSEEEATLNLNAMNKLEAKKPWSLSFSFGRALQQSTLKAWGGKKENVEKARAAFLARCKANGEATVGKYKGDAPVAEGAGDSLHVKGYTY